ncbi:TIGR04255 family protein [Sphingomonas koreensis]|nr:TIGR04255 family protein [Sphingomonas koreensis]
MGELPKKLSRDAILEALLEIRFDTKQVGEVLVGRLASAALFEGYSVSRLPISGIPAEAREADENLRFQPTLQMASPSPGELVKIGSHVISLHVVAPYPGWDALSERLKLMIETLFEAVRDVYISRLGLRYINAITPHHGVNRISDLQFRAELGGKQVNSEMVVSHRFEVDSESQGTISLATPSFVSGPNLPTECAAFVDIDIFTTRALGRTEPERVFDWVEKAHDAEKTAFFGLFSDAQIEKLKEE